MDETTHSSTLDQLEEEAQHALAHIQELGRAYRRLMLTASGSHMSEITMRIRLRTRAVHDAERALARALSGGGDESAQLYWVHPATRQTEVLQLLRETGEASATELGNRLGLHRSRTIAICHKLARRGLVRARRDPNYRGRRLLFSASESATTD